MSDGKQMDKPRSQVPAPHARTTLPPRARQHLPARTRRSQVVCASSSGGGTDAPSIRASSSPIGATCDPRQQALRVADGSFGADLRCGGRSLRWYPAGAFAPARSGTQGRGKFPARGRKRTRSATLRFRAPTRSPTGGPRGPEVPPPPSKTGKQKRACANVRGWGYTAETPGPELCLSLSSLFEYFYFGIY